MELLCFKHGMGSENCSVTPDTTQGASMRETESDVRLALSNKGVGIFGNPEGDVI